MNKHDLMAARVAIEYAIELAEREPGGSKASVQVRMRHIVGELKLALTKLEGGVLSVD